MAASFSTTILFSLVGFLVLLDSHEALAASGGGRVGGKCFSSPSSMTSSSSSGKSSSFLPRYSSPSSSFLPRYSSPSSSFSVDTHHHHHHRHLRVDTPPRSPSSFSSFSSTSTSVDKSSDIGLGVGLLGTARSLQSDLNQIAEAANISTRQGLHSLLTETILALLRHHDSYISSYSSVDIKQNIGEGEKIFNQLSLEERAKFDEETLVKANNIKMQSRTSQKATGFSNEYIVTTILVAAEGTHILPTINNRRDLKYALQKLASIPSNKTMAVEILWTPQAENHTLSERELLEDYPLLRPL